MPTLQDLRTQVITLFPASKPVSCASSPAQNSTFDSGIAAAGSTAAGSAIEGSKVYALSSNASRLLIYGVSNPGGMSLLGSQTLNSGAFAVNQPVTAAIGVLNSLAYIVNYPNAGNCYLAIYDCTNPAAITQKANPLVLSAAGTTNGIPRRVALFVTGADTYACVPFGDVINIIKVTNPAAPTSVATVTVPHTPGNGAGGVFVFNGNVYATAALEGRARAWSLSNPASPVSLFDTALTFANIFAVPSIYVVNQNNSPIAIVAIDDLANGGIQILNGTTGAILGTDAFTSLAVSTDGQLWADPTGACCFVALKNGAKVRLVNIGNTAAPVTVSDTSITIQTGEVVGLSTGTPANLFCAGTVGGGSFELEITSVNI